MHPAHVTFDTEGDADTWLSGVRADIARERYVCPIDREAAEEARRASEMPFSTYATGWLEDRRLKPGTRMLYAGFLDDLVPVFGDQPLTAISRGMVENWWRQLRRDRPDRETGNAHRYALLRTILGSAVRDGRVPANPCQIPGAGQPSGQRRPLNPATDDELDAIAEAMPESLALAVPLSAYCALRFGELAELRRRDVDMDQDPPVLNITRAVIRRGGRTIVDTPKSAAGVRSVHVPPHLSPALTEHLENHAQPGPDGLLFPSPATNQRRGCSCGYPTCKGGHLTSPQLYHRFLPAREAAGRPDLRWHDLRHTGAVEVARQGATLAETMARLGHSTVAAAMRYQHATKERDAELARRLSHKRSLHSEKG